MNQVDEKKGPNSPKEKEFTIIVNAKELEFLNDDISFDEVIALAFGSISNDPNIAYTITYKRGHGNKPEGSMVKGDTVKVKEGMIFNATSTDKS